MTNQETSPPQENLSSETIPQDTILVIDDVPDNMLVLPRLLRRKNFKILVATNGPYGLQVAENARPDLILLDVLMPGMNGFEVCQRLKSQSSTQDIPVIFMTALSDIADKVKGFQVGAADYVTKPLQYEEVLSRVSVHLKLRKLQQQLQEQNQRLQEQTIQLTEQTLELQARTKELEKRNQELDSFAHTVAHDLRNPMAGIVSLTELLEEDCYAHLKASKRLNMIKRSGQKIFSIISALLTLAGVSRQSQVQLQRLNMEEIVAQVIQQRLAQAIQEQQAQIVLPKRWPEAIGYAPWIEEIWANYISNGLKYGGQPPRLELGGEEIIISSNPPLSLDNTEDHTENLSNSPGEVAQGQRGLRFWIRDNGKGLSPEAQAKLFTPFTRLHSKTDGHGLGLSIVRQIAEKLGGQAGVESEVGKGSLFYFTLPIK